MLSLRFGQSFWNRGNFPVTITNTTTGDVIKLTNPWIQSPNNVAPFDQRESAASKIGTIPLTFPNRTRSYD